MDKLKSMSMTAKELNKSAEMEEKIMELLYWHRRKNVLSKLIKYVPNDVLEEMVRYENEILFVPPLKNNPQWVEVLPEYDGKNLTTTRKLQGR